jgi:hypothetical protein
MFQVTGRHHQRHLLVLGQFSKPANAA